MVANKEQKLIWSNLCRRNISIEQDFPIRCYMYFEPTLKLIRVISVKSPKMDVKRIAKQPEACMSTAEVFME